MANERFERFLIERLLTLDPNLSDQPGSPMDRTVVQPILTRLGADPFDTNFVQFVSDRLRDDPLTKELDIESAGGILKDVLARASAVLMEPLKREIQQVKLLQSLEDPSRLSREELDTILTNMFVLRKVGSVARGIVRVYLSTPRPFSVDASVLFSTAAGLQFVPSEPQGIVVSDFIRDGELYYAEIDVQSAVAHIGANVEVNSIRFVAGLDGVVRVTNPSKMSGGETSEDNNSYLLRVNDSLSERSLNSRRGIAATLFDNFSEMQSVDSVGYRHPLMNRDILRGTVSSQATALPGDVVVTSISAEGWPATGSATDPVPDPDVDIDWADANDLIPHSSVIQLDYPGNHAAFLTAWNAASQAMFCRVFGTDDTYDSSHLSRVRSIRSLKALDVNNAIVAATHASAVKLRVLLKDFEVLHYGNDAVTTPNANIYPDQGPDYKLTTSVNWRGAPLPFTDIITLNGAALSSYTVNTGRDYLVIRGHTDAGPYNSKHFRAYPIRLRKTSEVAQVRRVDWTMTSRGKAGQTVAFSEDFSKSMGATSPRVIAYGSPGLGDPSASASPSMFDGITTVPGGNTYFGGVALYEHDSRVNNEAYVFIKEHTSRPLGWASLGVSIGNYISLAAFSGDTTAGTTATQKFSWWQWARIEAVGVTQNSVVNYHILQVKGLYTNGIRGGGSQSQSLLDMDSLANIGILPSGNQWGWAAGSEYRLHWTVYEGELEEILPNGNLHTVPTDFAYAPCYDVTGETVGTGFTAAQGLYSEDLETYYPFIDGNAILSGDAIGRTVVPCITYGDGNTSHPSGLATQIDHQMGWAILRLKTDFRTDTLATGTKFISEEPSAETARIHNTLNTLEKYPNTVTLDTYNTITVPTNTPLALHHWKWSGVGLSPSKTTPAAPNQRGLRGYILPSYLSSGTVVQLMNQVDVTLEAPQITISEIPGSYPFTDEFGLPVTVNDNEVHIGGMTDIYIKPVAVDEETTSFKISPDDNVPDSSDLTLDVVHTGSVGQVLTAKSKEFVVTDLTSLFSQTDFEGMIGYSLWIVASTNSDIVGKAFRIIGVDFANDILRVDTSLNDTGINVYNIDYRVIQYIHTNIEEPRDILQNGEDLVIGPESPYVTSATGFTSWSDSLVGLSYLQIMEGGSKGEYAIVGKTANSLTLDTTLSNPETSLKFRVYTKVVGVDLPLVRIRSMTLASEDGNGIEVPYRLAIDSLAESFSGLNNDPIIVSDQSLVFRSGGDYDGTTGGDLNPAWAAVSSAGYAQMYHRTDATYDWTSKGIIKYDVIRVLSQDEEDTFYYITDVKSVGGVDSILILERDGTNKVGIDAEIGKPSLGDIQVFFMSPTYVEVTTNTVFKTTDGQTSFRPSPAEVGDVYESPDNLANVTITSTGADTATITSTSVDFSRLNFRIGDTVEILKEAIVSGNITDATAGDMTILIGSTFVVDVDGLQQTVVFTGSGTLTLSDIVSQINTSLGQLLIVKKVASTGYSNLKIYSKKSVTIKDSSASVLGLLGLTVNTNNSYGTSSKVSVATVSYDSTTNTSSLTVTEAAGGSNIQSGAFEVFIKVTRSGSQIVYPANMTKDDSGLYFFTMTASSRAPLISTRLAENTQLVIENYESYGYEFAPVNESYTYSKAEKTQIKTTPYILPDYATDHDTGFVLSSSNVDVSYDRSQLVEDSQSFVLSDFDRVMCNNPLCRHFFPAYIHVTVRTTGSSRTSQQQQQEISRYVSSRFPNKSIDPFSIEQVLGRIGVDSIEHPITMFLITHGPDRKVSISRSAGTIVLDERYHIMEDMTGIVVQTSGS